MFAGTWNVSQEKPSLQSLRMWLAEPSADASMVFVGIQEMEMGAGAIGIAAVKETVCVYLSLHLVLFVRVPRLLEILS